MLSLTLVRYASSKDDLGDKSPNIIYAIRTKPFTPKLAAQSRYQAILEEVCGGRNAFYIELPVA